MSRCASIYYILRFETTGVQWVAWVIGVQGKRNWIKEGQREGKMVNSGSLVALSKFDISQ